MRRVLGLDLGTNSIGWCLIEEQEKNVATDVVAGGVRIFQEAVDAKTRTPKNSSRRMARLTRRVIQRRARRKRRLRNYLISLGWIPECLGNDSAPEAWFNETGNPYELRKKGLDQELSEEEFARILLHICARRGFLSNRKTALMDLYNSDDPDVQAVLADDSSEEDPDAAAALSEEARAEESAFKKEIAELRASIEHAGARTLGEFLADLPYHERKRARRTERTMLIDEFEQLWESQRQYDPERYDDRTRLRLYEAIFFQRPLNLKPNRRGRCSLEPSRFRAGKATLAAQEFRLLQNVNNLRYVDRRTGELKSPDDDQRARLVDILMRQGSMSWPAARKEFRFHSRVKFNLEEHKNALIGNRTAAKVRQVDKVFWDGLSSATRSALVEDLLTIQDRYALYKRLKEAWTLPTDSAVAYAKLEFEPGFASLCIKAINKLLPHLRKGLIYSDARVAAGYGYEVTDRPRRDRLGEPPEARNPVVQKAMYEVRKLVNAVSRRYGKPDAVRIEMAREIKATAKEKARIEKQNKLNAKANQEAAYQYCVIRQQNPQLLLAEHPSRDDLQRYRLWREANEMCIYSGDTISLTQLWSAAVEVDHVLPYSRTLDDSYMNKVVCTAAVNREKGNRTPYEMWGADKEAFDTIRQRAERMPRGKQKRMSQRELGRIDDFISRQLNDTRYISRLVLGYMRTVFADVSISTGAATGFLRRQWGLNNVLSNTGEKTRADHRHHFIDAVVVALTNRRTYQQIATVASRADLDSSAERLSRLEVAEPIPHLRRKVSDLASDMVVSHALNRKLTGALHEDTLRGVHSSGCVTKRISINASTKASDVAKLVDPALRALLEQRLAEFGSKAKDAFVQPVSLGSGRTLRHAKIQSAKSVKPDAYLELKDSSGRTQRRAVFGNTHHVEVYRDAKGRVRSRFVTMFEAATRARRRGEPIIDRSADGGEFLFALHINDPVTARLNGRASVFRVQKLERDHARIALRLNCSATLDDQTSMLRKSISTLVDDNEMSPIRIDTLGAIAGH